MKQLPLVAIVLLTIASCESSDVVTGHARVTTLNTSAPTLQPAVQAAPQPAATPPAPAPQATAFQKQPKLKLEQKPEPAVQTPLATPAPRATASQIQPQYRVLTPPSSRPVKKKRVLMPGQNRGLKAR